MNEEIEVTARMRGQYKKVWKKQYEVVTYKDDMSDEEYAVFKNDTYFDELIIAAKKADKEIIDYMNFKLNQIREQAAIKLSQIKPVEPVKFKEEFE
jgi:hypothetical protein